MQRMHRVYLNQENPNFLKCLYFHQESLEYNITMGTKNKKQELTPWFINQEKSLADNIIDLQPKNKNKKQVVLPVDSEKIHLTRKRVSTLDSIVRLKTQKQHSKQIRLVKTPRISIKEKIKEVKPINRNLINIINTFKENENFPKNNIQKNKIKRNAKELPNIKRRISSSIQNSFVEISHRSKQKIEIDVKKIRQTLFSKKSQPIDTLIKVKEQLQKLNNHQDQQKPMLRTYSVQNIRLNEPQKKNKIVRNENEQFFSNVKKRTMSVHIEKQKSKDSLKIPEIYLNDKKLRLKYLQKVIESQHIIDRLYAHWN